MNKIVEGLLGWLAIAAGLVIGGFGAKFLFPSPDYWWLHFLGAGVGLYFGYLYAHRPGTYERARTDSMEQEKLLRKERGIQKTCSWCNRTFTWASSGHRYHCSARCESEQRKS